MAIRQGILFHVLSGLICLWSTLFACSCMSQTTPREDSNRYVAVAQVQPQGYPCPSCGYRIDVSNVNKNIRMENICPSCRKSFFYTPVMESSKAENYQRRYGNYGPRNYGPTSVYQSDLSYQRFGIGGYSFNETSTGFSELSWNFRDSKVKSYRVIPRWTTTRYHYP